MKKVLAVLLSLAMIFSLICIPTMTASADLTPGDGGTVDKDDDFDDTIAQDVIDMINALGEITLEKSADVEAARAAYDALTTDQKAFVDAPTLKKLTDAEALINTLGALKNFEDLVNALGELADVDTLDEAVAKVIVVRTAYEALTTAQKALVPPAIMDKFETYSDAVKEIVDVVDAIDDLGEITSLDQEPDVIAAEGAYNDLSQVQKDLVPQASLDTLDDAKDAIEALKNTGLRGDLDENGTVNLADIVMMRNWIMEGAPSANRIAKGDLDGNNQINLADIVALRNIIMGVA